MSLPTSHVYAEEVRVEVKHEAAIFTVSASVNVPVTTDVAWAVLTDFAHLPQFLHNVQHVTILEHRDNRYRIEESGEAAWGILSLSYVNVRDIYLYPKEFIATKTLSGTVKSMETSMHLKTSDSHQVSLDYHAIIEPDSWLASLFGAEFIKTEVRQQFEALATEMEKRQALIH